MSDGTMRDILTRLEAQEAELAAARARIEAQGAQLAALHARRQPARRPRRTRGQVLALAVVAALIALVPLSLFAANPFTDLQGTVHDPDIDTIYNLGITTGCSPTEYCPTENVTRQEMASFLARTAALNRMAFVSRPTAAPADNLGTSNPRDYMSVVLTVPGQANGPGMIVKVGFTGYAFARSTTGCPCLLRGEIRVGSETAGASATPAQIVTRTVVGANPSALVNPGPAERVDFSGSRVFVLQPGTYTFTMSLFRETGTAEDVGFGFGNMQAETVAFAGNGTTGNGMASTPLNGAEEISPAGAPNAGDPDGTGTATITLNRTTGEVCYTVNVANIATPTAAHIHRGVAGTNGPVVVDFVPPTGSNCVMASPALVQEIDANPAGFYVNVHNGEYPGGAVRGQLDD
jgi:hypothetical protein